MRDLDELQQHESEQQQLLQEIQREVTALEEELGRKHVTTGLILATLAYLAPRGNEKAEGQVAPFDFIPCLRFFDAKVRKPIEKFTEDEVERLALIARFFEWLATSFTEPFKSELLRSQIEADSEFPIAP